MFFYLQKATNKNLIVCSLSDSNKKKKNIIICNACKCILHKKNTKYIVGCTCHKIKSAVNKLKNDVFIL